MPQNFTYILNILGYQIVNWSHVSEDKFKWSDFVKAVKIEGE